MTITPSLATMMLKQNTRNRPLREVKIAYYVKEMKSGRWKYNGDSIRFSISGILLDGQHRLIAVVRSGCTIEVDVIEGLPDDVFDTIDVGKSRSNSDTLATLGEKNANRLVAALILIDKYKNGAVEKSLTYNNMEVQELLEKYPGARQSLMTTFNVTGLIYPSVIDACHYLFSEKKPGAGQ